MSEQVVHFLMIGTLKEVEDILEEKMEFIEGCQQFQLLSKRLHYLREEKILRLVVCPKYHKAIMSNAYVSSCGFHFSKDNIVRRKSWQGFWWPTLREDVAKFANKCPKCRKMMPTLYATLYHVSTLPRWSKNIVEYLQMGKIPKHRRRSLEVDAITYTFLGEQLYKRGKDGNLRLCICENEYIPIL